MSDERDGPTKERLTKVKTAMVDVLETVSKGGAVRMTGRRIITPLDSLRHDERITEREHAAGMRYYADYVYAERPSQAVMRWREFVSSSHSPGELDGAERAAFHSRRFADANAYVGRYLASVVRMLVVEDLTVGEIGSAVFGYKNLNSACSAGTALVSAALDRLASFYRL